MSVEWHMKMSQSERQGLFIAVSALKMLGNQLIKNFILNQQLKNIVRQNIGALLVVAFLVTGILTSMPQNSEGKSNMPPIGQWVSCKDYPDLCDHPIGPSGPPPEGAIGFNGSFPNFIPCWPTTNGTVCSPDKPKDIIPLENITTIITFNNGTAIEIK